MKKTTGVKWGNLKVGILLLFAVAVMFWASLSGGGTSIFNPKSNFICYFRNVNGLVPGAPVWLSGVEVGNVKSVSFVNLDSLRQVKLVCRIKSSVWNMLTEGTQVQLGTIGFLGDKYVEIVPGPKGKPLIAKGGVIPTRDAGSAEAVFKKSELAMDKAKNIAGNLDTLLMRINEGEGTLGRLATDDRLYTEMTTLLSRLTALTADLQKNQERILTSIEKTASSVQSLSEQVNTSQGTVGKLINDPKLYDNLTAISMRMDSIVSKINTAEGSLGLLVNDTALYIEVTNLTNRINNLITDIEKDPRKYFKFSVF